MENWRDIAHDSRTAAFQLFASRRWRSCASRAYYAAYAEATHHLLKANVTMPAGRDNPSHAALATLIGNDLVALRMEKRWRLAGVVTRLYYYRVIADYAPALPLTPNDARVSLGLMATAFQLTKDLTWELGRKLTPSWKR